MDNNTYQEWVSKAIKGQNMEATHQGRKGRIKERDRPAKINPRKANNLRVKTIAITMRLKTRILVD
jgi:hypothetical protein